MEMREMDDYYRRSSQVASRVVGGEAVLVKLPENQVYVLNALASRIWVEADGRRTGRELGRNWLGDLVGAFLAEMVALGLLVRSASPCRQAAPFPQELALAAEGSGGSAPKILSVEPLRIPLGLCASVPNVSQLAGCALQN